MTPAKNPKTGKRLNPLNDYLFQKYMGEKGDEEQLISFLNAVLKRTRKEKIIELEILENKTLTADIIGDKTAVLDVLAVLQDNTKVNIEVQLRNVGGNMDKRSLFYWSREFVKGIESGSHYQDLPNVIVINLLDFGFIPLDDFHTSFHLWEDTNKDYMLTPALEIHFVDMVKFRRLADADKDIKNNSLHRWLTFFDKRTSEQAFKEVVEMETAIAKAHEKIIHVSQDQDSLRLYERREMGLMDYASGVHHARKEGKEEGRQGAFIEMTKNLLRANVDIKIISVSTGLDEDIIQKLQEELESVDQ